MIKIEGFIGSDLNDFNEAPPHTILVEVTKETRDKIERLTENYFKHKQTQVLYPTTHKYFNNKSHHIVKVKLLKKSIIEKNKTRGLRADLMNNDVTLELHPHKFNFVNNDDELLGKAQGQRMEGLALSITKVII
jgi:hypothetical protein